MRRSSVFLAGLVSIIVALMFVPSSGAVGTVSLTIPTAGPIYYGEGQTNSNSTNGTLTFSGVTAQPITVTLAATMENGTAVVSPSSVQLSNNNPSADIQIHYRAGNVTPGNSLLVTVNYSYEAIPGQPVSDFESFTVDILEHPNATANNTQDPNATTNPNGTQPAEDSPTLMYAAIALIVVAVIAAVSFILWKKKQGGAPEEDEE